MDLGGSKETLKDLVGRNRGRNDVHEVFMYEIIKNLIFPSF